MRVELRHITHDAERLIGEAYGACRGGRGEEAIPLENIRALVTKKPFPHLSCLRHATATFYVYGISRACHAQLIRHGLAAFSVESQRSVGPTGFVYPQTIVDSEFRVRYDALLQHAKVLYEDMVEGGIPREDARYGLPLSTATFLVITANFEHLRWLAQIRGLNLAAQWEIRELCGKILDILKAEAPYVFGDLGEP